MNRVKAQPQKPLIRESERRRRESALTILFTATMLLNSRLRLARLRATLMPSK
jgi:hypothetical protein